MVNQIAAKITTAEKRIRSAKPPTTSATVIQANEHWNATWIIWLKVPVTLSMPMPFSIAVWKPPKKALPSLNARL
ncbi:hypothetical protein D3C77_714610 [compost metagenome]